MNQIGIVCGLHVGKVEKITTRKGRTFHSGIRKLPCNSAELESTGFVNDFNADPAHHTIDRAVHFFDLSHYKVLEAKMNCSLPKPSFGENITGSGVSEEDVFVGDVLSIGNAKLEVTQPTERCKTIGASLGKTKILKHLHELELCGFYARVIECGVVANSDPIYLVERQQSDWSIKALHRFMFTKLHDDKMLAEVQSLQWVSDEWKDRIKTMRNRLAKGVPISSNLIDL